MANTLITPQNVARAALASYQYNSIIPRLVNRAYVTEFGGGSGDTVTIRKQATLSTNLFDRQTGIVTQDITEGSITLKIGDIYDISAIITQEQWDLDLTDFSFQVAEPAGKAMHRQAEKLIVAQLADAMTAAPSRVIDLDVTDPLKSFVDARAVLNKDEVPGDGRVWLVGNDVASALLKSDNLVRVDYAGDADALRGARIGRLFGYDVVESPVIDPKAGYIMHRDALTMVSLTPAMPRGTVSGSVQTYDSTAMRVVFSYDQLKKQDVVSFDAYMTAKVIRPEGIAGLQIPAS